MVPIEQRPLHAPPLVWISVHGDHIGDIGGCGADAPAIPIEQPDAVAVALPRQEAIPHMRVAVINREVTTCVIPIQ
jgi:hypothetical protein